ncbi:hypothetical protein EPI10_021370 [Gossypium australe]|uniref:Uncharacterized protein n=1 Tax=Gossypium australe TaxID=47621 RepID=A0A5B6WGR6_9ROSI|nr:hypothetical protein EPI10_021370 [Gossypium australe]
MIVCISETKYIFRGILKLSRTLSGKLITVITRFILVVIKYALVVSRTSVAFLITAACYDSRLEMGIGHHGFRARIIVVSGEKGCHLSCCGSFD